MITKDLLLERLKELELQKSEAVATLHAIAGAIQENQYLTSLLAIEVKEP